MSLPEGLTKMYLIPFILLTLYPSSSCEFVAGPQMNVFPSSSCLSVPSVLCFSCRNIPAPPSFVFLITSSESFRRSASQPDVPPAKPFICTFTSIVVFMLRMVTALMPFRFFVNFCTSVKARMLFLCALPSLDPGRPLRISAFVAWFNILRCTFPRISS